MINSKRYTFLKIITTIVLVDLSSTAHATDKFINFFRSNYQQPAIRPSLELSSQNDPDFSTPGNNHKITAPDEIENLGSQQTPLESVEFSGNQNPKDQVILKGNLYSKEVIFNNASINIQGDTVINSSLFKIKNSIFNINEGKLTFNANENGRLEIEEIMAIKYLDNTEPFKLTGISKITGSNNANIKIEPIEGEQINTQAIPINFANIAIHNTPVSVVSLNWTYDNIKQQLVPFADAKSEEIVIQLQAIPVNDINESANQDMQVITEEDLQDIGFKSKYNDTTSVKSGPIAESQEKMLDSQSFKDCHSAKLADKKTYDKLSDIIYTPKSKNSFETNEEYASINQEVTSPKPLSIDENISAKLLIAEPVSAQPQEKKDASDSENPNLSIVEEASQTTQTLAQLKKIDESAISLSTNLAQPLAQPKEMATSIIEKGNLNNNTIAKQNKNFNNAPFSENAIEQKQALPNSRPATLNPLLITKNINHTMLKRVNGFIDSKTDLLPSAGEQDNNYHAWGESFIGYQKVKGSAGHSSNFFGFSLGAEKIFDNTLLGAAITTISNKSTITSSPTNYSQNYVGSIYSAAQIEKVFLSGSIHFGKGQTKLSSRNNPSAKINNTTYGLRGIIGYDYKNQQHNFRPFAEVQYFYSIQDAYTDSAQNNQSFAKKHSQILKTGAGIQYSYDTTVGNTLIKPGLAIGIAKDILHKGSVVNEINEAGQAKFAPFNNKELSVWASPSLKIQTDNLSQELSYTAEKSKSSITHIGSVKLSLAF